MYGGRLAGDALKPRHVLPVLRDGRAWGAGVAAWHQAGTNLLAFMDALAVMRESVDADLQFMEDSGVLTDTALDARNDALARLEQMLRHYVSLDDPLPNLTRLEDTIDVPVPSRSGLRGSNRYRYGGKIDGFTVDENGDEWIVEFKLRGKLHPRWLVELMRQYRWYAWARQRESGRKVVGMVIDERWNEIPKPPKILRNGSVSNDKAQKTTVPLYLEACRERGQDPDMEAVLEFQSRIWQQRIYVLFRPDELAKAGLELTSAARTVQALDSGEVYPVRNASQVVCNGCRFKRICADPNGELVDELFLRVPPKRLRETEAIQLQEVAV
jgi:hypothetical protein